MFYEQIFGYRKSIVKTTLLIFIILEVISLTVFGFQYRNVHHIHTASMIGLSAAYLFIGIITSFLIIQITECKLLRQNDPDIKLMLTDKKKLILLNRSAITFFKLGRLKRKEQEEKVTAWVDDNIENLFKNTFEKFEYKSGDRTILFTKIIDRRKNKIMIFGSDITDQKTNEAEIRKLLAGMEQSANSIVITDLDGRITFVNAAFEKMTGYGKNEVIGKSPVFMQSGYHTVDFYEELWDTITRGDVWHGKFLNKRKDGDLYWEDATITPVNDDKSGLYAFIAVKEDVSLRIALEKELRSAKTEAEKANRLKSDFIANMSHEIRTPLNGILGLTDVMQAEESDSSKKKKLKLIHESGTELLNMVNKILDLSKIESDKFIMKEELFSVQGLLNDLRKMFSDSAGERNLSLEFNTAADIPEQLKGGRNQIRNILINLIGNAVKFTEKGYVRVSSSYIDGRLNFEIEDSGIGIPANLQASIFNSFQQADAGKNRGYEGTGLGLTLAKRLADLLGGYINVKSIEGKGSTFVFNTPVLPDDSDGYSEVLPLEKNDDEHVSNQAEDEQADEIAGYDLSVLSESEMEKLSEEFVNLRKITNDEDIDEILEITKRINMISDKPVLAGLTGELRKYWELIDVPSMSRLVSKLENDRKRGLIG